MRRLGRRVIEECIGSARRRLRAADCVLTRRGERPRSDNLKYADEPESRRSGGRATLSGTPPVARLDRARMELRADISPTLRDIDVPARIRGCLLGGAVGD